MKKLLLLFLLGCQFASAAIVNIPDANFKAMLLSASENNSIASTQFQSGVAIDTNGDGEIQTTEAALITTLQLNGGNIVSLEGLSAFSNLTYLSIQSNPITNMNLSGLGALTYLTIGDCSQHASINLTGLTSLRRFFDSNSLAVTSIDISGLAALEEYYLHNAPAMQNLTVGNLPNVEKFTCEMTFYMQQIDVTGLTNVKDLRLSANNFSTLNVAPLVHVETLLVEYNNLSAIDISTLANLRGFSCGNNHLTSLDLTGLNQLESLGVGDNDLTALDLSVVPQLKSLAIGQNAFTTLDFSPLTQLESFYINHAQFSDLDLSHNVNLTHATFWNLAQSEVDFTNLVNLVEVNMVDSHITSMDLSHTVNPLQTVEMMACPELEFVNLKNGHGLNYLRTAGSPQLRMICVDDFVPYPSPVFNIQTTPENVMVGTYCSFVPGGEYHTISGQVHYDINANGCGEDDPPVAFAPMVLNLDNTGTIVTMTDALGQYHFYTRQQNLSVSMSAENQGYFTVSPATIPIDLSSGNVVSDVNFCLSANGVHNDVETVIIPIGVARPGFDAQYKVVYHNKGNQMATGTVTFGYDDAVFDLVSAAPAADSNAVGTLTFGYANLAPFESREILITLNLNGPMEDPAVNIGDHLTLTSAILIADVEDEMPDDNTFIFDQMVVGSFDPNDKHCLEGTSVNPSQIGKYLHYQVNFENTGTAPAENIVVKDVIDAAKFEISTFQFINSSHPAQVRITGNKVEFIFEGINLGESQHGYVVFKIKTKSSLSVNSSVTNKADIFFDYNFPVTTDPAVTVFEVLGTKGFDAGPSVRIYPNPANGLVRIQSEAEILSLQLYDAGGRVLSKRAGAESSIDVSGYAPGVYYLRVATSKGSKIEKILKK